MPVNAYLPNTPSLSRNLSPNDNQQRGVSTLLNAYAKNNAKRVAQLKSCLMQRLPSSTQMRVMDYINISDRSDVVRVISFPDTSSAKADLLNALLKPHHRLNSELVTSIKSLVESDTFNQELDWNPLTHRVAIKGQLASTKVTTQTLIKAVTTPELQTALNKRKVWRIKSLPVQPASLPAPKGPIKTSLSIADQNTIKAHIEQALDQYLLEYGRWEIMPKMRRLAADPLAYTGILQPNHPRLANGKWASPKHLQILSVNPLMDDLKIDIEQGRVKLIGSFPDTPDGLVQLLNRLIGKEADITAERHDSNKSSLIKLLTSGDPKTLETLSEYVDIAASEKNLTTKKYRVLFLTRAEAWAHSTQPLTVKPTSSNQIRITGDESKAQAFSKQARQHLLEQLASWQHEKQLFDHLEQGGTLQEALEFVARYVDKHYPKKTVMTEHLSIRMPRLTPLSKQTESSLRLLSDRDIQDTQRKVLQNHTAIKTFKQQINEYVQHLNQVNTHVSKLKAVSNSSKAIEIVDALENQEITPNHFLPKDIEEMSSIKRWFHHQRAKFWAWVTGSCNWQPIHSLNAKSNQISKHQKLDSIRLIHFLMGQQSELNDFMEQEKLDTEASVFKVLLADTLLKYRDQLKYKNSFQLGFGRLKRRAFENLIENQLGIKRNAVRDFKTNTHKIGIEGTVFRIRNG